MAVSESVKQNSIVTNSTQKEYERVVISLENCILPDEKISSTPSLLDGVDIDSETDLRILGCEHIQVAGILLRLPQVAMASGQILFHRFYYSKSFVKQNVEIVAMACVCLASKIEESPRRIRDVCNVFNHIKQVSAGKTITPLILDQNYINLKNQVIKAERRILKELGFCVHIKHPHKTVVTMLQLLDSSDNHKLIQRSWNYMNDSLRTNVFVRYSPETIACACIYLSARELKVILPNKPAWYLLFDATEEDIQDICRTILRLYTRTPPDADKLDQLVTELKSKQLEAKMKNKGLSGCNTPITAQGFSPGSRTTSPKNSAIDKKDAITDQNKENGNTPHSDKNNKQANNHIGKRDRSRSSSRGSSAKDDKARSGSASTSPVVHSSKKHDRSPPRSYKEHRHHHHHKHRKSRSRSRDKKENRHKLDKKRRRSRSRSVSPIAYKKIKEHPRSRKSSRSYSRSPIRHDKPHRTSRKERSTRDYGRSHSRDRSRR